MKDEVLTYFCGVQSFEMYLYLECWCVGTYPLTFTPQECLEEFCYVAGWEFVTCRGRVGCIGVGNLLFKCRIPKRRLVMNVIYDWYQSHRDNV